MLHFVLHWSVEGLGEIVVDRLSDFHILFVDDMLVYIFQHIVGGMPHTFHGIFVGYIVHQHHGSIIVAQRFEVDLLQTQFISESGHFIGNPDGSQSEQGLICFFALQRGFQFGDEEWWYCKLTDARRRLRCFTYPFSIFCYNDGCIYAEDQIFQIYILAEDAAYFTSS